MGMTRCTSVITDPQMRPLLQSHAMKDLYAPFRPKIQNVESLAAMREILTRFTSPDCRFYGFDSFIGLPERWTPNAKIDLSQGAFSQKGAPPEVSDARVEFIKGWIQNTLPEFIQSGQIEPSRTHLVHFDADLYSATLFILTTLWHYLPEYYFMMDEYRNDEIVALRDFVSSFPVEIEFFGEFADKNFGRLRRTEFVLANK
jgi:hypothetical protein